MDNKETQEAIDKFRKYVVQQSKANLTRTKKNSSKKLYNSIKGVSKVNPNSLSLYFEMEDYGEFQDKGVNGKKSAWSTGFSFKKYVASRKMLSSLDKWIVRKGIAPRDAKGKFIDRRSLKFAIARSIFNNGIKPSLFFTKPFEKAFKTLPDELVEAYGLDAVNTFISRK